MKKIISFLLSFLGLAILYIWIYWIVYNTSDNNSMKHIPVYKAFADLNFYYDKLGNSKYYSESSEIYWNKWTSTEYPNWSYSEVLVTHSSVLMPASRNISTVVTNITVHSH